MLKVLGAAVLAIAMSFPTPASGTEQIPDRIRIDGADHALNTNPLESEIARQGWKLPEGVAVSTANWRGYTASWEIVDDRLVLRDASILVPGDGSDDHASRSIVADLFPSATAPLVARWYSGALIIPQGRITHHVHMGYGSSYERYRVIRVSSGDVIERLELSGEEFQRYKATKFEAFMKTDEFRQQLRELREEADGLTDEQILDFMMSYHAERYLSL